MLHLLNVAACLWAQTPDPVGTGSAGAEQVQSIWDFIVKGGPMMIPLGICSLLAVAIIVERAFSLRRSKILPKAFMSRLQSLLKKSSRDYAGALKYCQEHSCPMANILAAGLKRFSRPLDTIEKHIEEAGIREAVQLRKHLRFLSVTAAITPLMGLLGTIFGMIKAFQTVAFSAGALGKTELMATGIYEALITTAAGLLIAIPVLVCYHWLSAHIERAVFDMDQMTIEFLEAHAPAAVPQ